MITLSANSFKLSSRLLDYPVPLWLLNSTLFLCSKMKGSDNQEKLVYQIIEDAGNKGKPVKEEAEKKCLWD